jgi:lipopolysaccharide heptosyltransferase II
MKRILVIQTAFLGDVILATPVIAELKRIFPTSEISVLVKKGNEALLENNPHLQEIFAFEKSKGKYKELLRLVRAFRRLKFDLVINLHRFGSSGLLTALSGAKKTIGFDKNPFSFTYSKRFQHAIGDGTHEVARNLSLIQEYGAVVLRRPELYPSQSVQDRVNTYTQTPFFCFAPASVWYTKQLPLEKWIDLARHKLGEGKIYLLGGKQDYDLCEHIRNKVQSDQVVNLCGTLNLLESAALMSKAQRNFVNDSGPLHIASAMNAPVTAFFCSTIPAFGFGPLSEDSRVLQVEEKLSCRPCGLHGHSACPRGNFKCGMDINLSHEY